MLPDSSTYMPSVLCLHVAHVVDAARVIHTVLQWAVTSPHCKLPTQHTISHTCVSDGGIMMRNEGREGLLCALCHEGMHVEGDTVCYAMCMGVSSGKDVLRRAAAVCAMRDVMRAYHAASHLFGHVMMFLCMYMCCPQSTPRDRRTARACCHTHRSIQTVASST